jgi:hypothetical protein
VYHTFIELLRKKPQLDLGLIGIFVHGSSYSNIEQVFEVETEFKGSDVLYSLQYAKKKKRSRHLSSPGCTIFSLALYHGLATYIDTKAKCRQLKN